MNKIKHIFAALALVILASIAFSAAAQSIQSGDFSYVVDDNTLKIVKYTGNAESLTIPDSVDGYRVKTIGDSVFYGNKTLKNIDLGKGISIIGSHAFYESGLIDIVIPTNVTVIGLRAFGNSDLKRIHVDDSNLNLLMLNDSDNKKCPFSDNKLDYYYLGRNISSSTTWDYSGFIDCKTLVTGSNVTKCNIDKSTGKKAKVIVMNNAMIMYCTYTPINPKSLDAYLRDFGYADAVYINTGKINAGLIIKGIPYSYRFSSSSKVEIIDAEFEPNKMQDITLPLYTSDNKSYRVRYVGDSAFYKCSELSTLIIPDSYLGVGESAFEECENLTNVVLGDSIEKLDKAFRNCNKLESVNLNTPRLETLSESFYGCSSLKAIELGDKVKSIDKSFRDCTALETVKLGKRIAEIGTNAFFNCSSLKNINLTEYGIVNEIGNNAFAGTRIEEIDFDYPVKAIGAGAFQNCTLKKVNFSKKVTTIYDYAFINARITKLDLSQVYELRYRILQNATVDTLYLGNNVTSYASFGSIGYPASVKYLDIGEKFENLYNYFSSTTDIKTVICHNPNPPEGASFSDEVYQNATLLVPEGSIDLYRYSDGWKNFYTIKASGVNDVVRDADRLSGDDGYYDLQGRKVANPQKGIYIHRGQKVIVK